MLSKIFLPLFLLLIISHHASPQFPGGGNRGGMGSRMMSAGRFYGKVVDAKTNKSIEFAAVQLFQTKRDSVSKEKNETMINGQLTKANGDFSLDSIPVFGDFTLKISALGYKPFEQKVSFNRKTDRGGDRQQAMSNVDKDLGNIPLAINLVTLSEVTVTETTPVYEMKIDRKVYNVEKSLVTVGGTAEDVFKNVPSVNVDIDGNVTMRNATPQIFVDGRPTTLTVDQIPADAIQSIEVITNPSAKFDASGGGAGILNIVLKKNRRIGYNGNIKAGVDSRGRANLGADLNARQDKINLFVSGNLNQRKTKVTGETNREYFAAENIAAIKYVQQNPSESNGYMGMVRAGFDYFMDNRNTITLAGSYNRGSFTSVDNISTVTDTLYMSGTKSNASKKINNTERSMRNIGSSLSFKHIYPKDGKEITADVNYNGSRSESFGNYNTQYYEAANNPSGAVILQQVKGNSLVDFATLQTDFVNPLNEKTKIECGARAAIRDFVSSTNNYLYNYTDSDYAIIPSQVNNYKFIDEVFAGYFIFTKQLKKFGYSAGLRAESSVYDGELIDSQKKFSHTYPVSLFPSAFVSYKVNDKNDLQLNYTRKINRPNFFQLLPYTDYTDSLNLSRGNPDLKPEFTNSLELAWQKNFGKKNTLITSVYYKNTTDLITRYQLFSFDTTLMRNEIISTYQNANSGTNYGGEITSQNALASWLDVMFNINVYNSSINSTNVESTLTSQQLNMFSKLNTTIKPIKNFSIQFSAEYQSKNSLTQNSGGGRGYGGGGDRGGMSGGGGGGSSSTAQGYSLPSFALDVALKCEFLKNKMASFTINVSDILKTKKSETFSQSSYFTQTTIRRRDPQVIRATFTYRFGKFDVSLFKRKNNKMNMDGIEM